VAAFEEARAECLCDDAGTEDADLHGVLLAGR
jgi:hypothetical protein